VSDHSQDPGGKNLNNLKDSASPYLRSAAHQPINWQEWGEPAFAKARAEGKPILLDVGAVWCHWCHVIDRESYENPALAAIINEHYIPVKVDRDERPDVDSRYQAAVSAMTGQGGWPLTAFLTPEGKPFFGGTYFPPEDAMGRPGFRRILLGVAEAFRTKREEVDKTAKAIEEAVSHAEAFQGARADFDPTAVDAMVGAIVRMFDLRNGGFGQSPKFPHAAAIDLLLERYQSTKEPALLTVVEKTLEKMAQGGVYDQLAGGFHRYSVDERWLVPHFEKMSYDNSELLKNYLHGYQVTGRALFRETAEGIIAWTNEVLSDQKNGGFYGSQDADQTLDDDGDYFTWTQAEVRAELTPEESRVIEICYDVEPHGEMHHNPAKNVLWVAHPIEEVARELKVSETDARLLIARAKGKLLDARRKRQTPAIDTTSYVSWNAMYASAYLESARVLDREDCKEFALKTIDKILNEAWDETRGFQHRLGGPKLEGSLDDQIFMGLALLDAYESTLDIRYFDSAERSLKLTIEKFADAEGGGFFDRSRDAAAMGGLDLARKPFQDSPTPGTNSMAAVLCDRMYGLTGNQLFHEWAEKTLEAFAKIAPQFGLFAASYALAALLHSRHVLQVVIAGAADDPAAAALEQAANQVYRFGKSVLRVPLEKIKSVRLPAALAETIPDLPTSAAQALVCVETTCYAPIKNAAELKAVLNETRAAAV
jgi:uncharacterized protein YyaL (SSP411 family)